MDESFSRSKRYDTTSATFGTCFPYVTHAHEWFGSHAVTRTTNSRPGGTLLENSLVFLFAFLPFLLAFVDSVFSHL